MLLRVAYPQRPVPVSSNLLHAWPSDVSQTTARNTKMRVSQSFNRVPQSQLFLNKDKKKQSQLPCRKKHGGWSGWWLIRNSSQHCWSKNAQIWWKFRHWSQVYSWPFNLQWRETKPQKEFISQFNFCIRPFCALIGILNNFMFKLSAKKCPSRTHHILSLNLFLPFNSTWF